MHEDHQPLIESRFDKDCRLDQAVRRAELECARSESFACGVIVGMMVMAMLQWAFYCLPIH